MYLIVFNIMIYFVWIYFVNCEFKKNGKGEGGGINLIINY